MGGRNRRWQDGSSNPRPPPPYPGYYRATNQCPVPLWEREFCSFVGGISWQSFCENKHFAYMCKKIEQWDDSASFESFQNAKSRFWSHYNGQPSDIPLPNPELYIEKVDYHCEIDPELVADLEKVRLPFQADNESGNWDVYVAKPAELNKWEEDNSRVNPDPLNGWNKISSGWGDDLVQPSWGSSSNNHCPANNWDSYHGASNNTYQDPRNTYGRKRNGVVYSQQRNRKLSNRDEDYQRSRWQDHRQRNGERFPFDNRPNGQRIDNRAWLLS